MNQKEKNESIIFLNKYRKLKNKSDATEEDYITLFQEYEDYRIPAYFDGCFKELMTDYEFLAKILEYVINSIGKHISYNYILNKLQHKDSRIKKANDYHKCVITDTLIQIDNYYILFECNMVKSKTLISKNNHATHGVAYSMIDEGEKPGKKTCILLSFDMYDRFGRNELIYKSSILDERYYNDSDVNYKIFNFSLESACNTLYNTNIEQILSLGEIEKALIFMVNPVKRIGKILGDDKKFMKGADEKMNGYLGSFSDMIHHSYRAMEREIKYEAREEGKKEGKEEAIISVVNNMLSENVDINIISKFTKLSICKINKIKNDIANKNK